MASHLGWKLVAFTCSALLAPSEMLSLLLGVRVQAQSFAQRGLQGRMAWAWAATGSCGFLDPAPCMSG